MSASRYPAPAELRDLIIMLLQVGKLVQVGLSAELESAIGLTVGEIDVLANLAHAPDGRLRMSQIGDRVSSDEVAVIQAAFAKILTGLGSGEAGCGAKVDDAAKALVAKAGPGPTPTETTA